jgi:hypothetical protein
MAWRTNMAAFVGPIVPSKIPEYDPGKDLPVFCDEFVPVHRTVSFPIGGWAGMYGSDGSDAPSDRK